MNSVTSKTYLHKTFWGMRKTQKITKQKHGYVPEKWRRRGKIGFIPGRCPLKNGGGEEKSASCLVGVLKNWRGFRSCIHFLVSAIHTLSFWSWTHGNDGNVKLDDKKWRGSHHLPTLCVPSKIKKWRRGCAGTHMDNEKTPAPVVKTYFFTKK